MSWRLGRGHALAFGFRPLENAMGVLWTKLQNRWSRDRHLPVSTRIQSEIGTATRYVGSAVAGLLLRRNCTSVGPWARIAGGLPRIDNQGFIGIGSHTVLVSTFCPVQLLAGPKGRIEIGDGAVLNFGTIISARERVSIGKRTSLGPYCIISDTDVSSPDCEATKARAITIEDDVWIAAHVNVAPGARIGKGAVITAGSSVVGEIPPGVVAGGSPARILRTIEKGAPIDPQHAGSLHGLAADVPHATAPLAGSVPSGAALHSRPPVPEPSSSLRSGVVVMPGTGPSTPCAASEKAGASEFSSEPTGAQQAVVANAELHHSADPVVAPQASPLGSAVSRPSSSQKGLLVSDFTIQQLADVLNEPNNPPFVSFEVAPYGQVIPTLIHPPPGIDVAVVWTRPEAVVASFGRAVRAEQVDPSDLVREVDAFCDHLVNCSKSVQCLLVASWTMPHYMRGFGMIDTRKGGLTRALASMNMRLMERLDDVPNAHVLHAQRWVEGVGRAACPPKLWYMGKVPFHPEVWSEAAADIMAALSGLAGRARKLLILDLDDTLWGGIVGDVGWENLRLGGHDAIGEAFVDFQLAVKALQRRGVVLGIVSKNTEEVALEAIRKHPAMVLRESDFVAHKINWRDKAQNVVDLVAEVNLGLQSVVFIDDNPVERARVREALPEVFVPEWPEDKTLYASSLWSLRCFDAPTISKEDLERTQMYTAERKREGLKSEVGSLDDWLSQLGIQVVVEPLRPDNLARTTQLLNKTNQMNLSTRRLSEQELSAWAHGAQRQLWAVRVSDRFGDAGLTGIASLEFDDHGTLASIVDFVLSCRVMGRKIEETMLHVLVEAARRRGVRSVEARYLPTAKNKPCLEFWQRSGFESKGEHHFVWDGETSYPLPKFVELRFDA